MLPHLVLSQYEDVQWWGVASRGQPFTNERTWQWMQNDQTCFYIGGQSVCYSTFFRCIRGKTIPCTFHGGAQTGEISLASLDHGTSQTQTLGEWHFRFCRKLPKDHHVEICSPEVLGMAGVEPNFPSGKKSYSDNCCTSNSRLRILESSDDVALWSMRTTTEVDNNVDQWARFWTPERIPR